MRLSAPCKLRCATLVLAGALSGCPVRTPPAPARPPAALPAPAPHLGAAYAIVPGQSQLLIFVYRGGALASAGHNHLIASHDLGGTFYVPPDPLQASFEITVPVTSLTVDEESLRAAEHSSDFPPGVPDDARTGTRTHMLGADQLDGEHSPQILLRSVSLGPASPAAPDMLLAQVQVSVRGGTHALALPVHYERSADTVVASGEAEILQSELGIAPYSAMLGALQVQDQLRVKFRIQAQAAH
ncbi:MAG TPA: YceI family protein [Steroidobacteraceae bacterium]|jgi:polyisoprenoid-binding protein YceI